MGVVAKALDITNMRFGSLVAIADTGKTYKGQRVWEFQCDCGAIVEKVASRVKSGVSSCSKDCPTHSPIKPEEKYNQLTAIQQTQKRDVHGNVLWEFLCDCGETVYAPAYDVKRGSRKTCGKCVETQTTLLDIGSKHGKLTILDIDIGDGKFNSIKYKCQCSCENKTIVDVPHYRLRGNRSTRSCGCAIRDSMTDRPNTSYFKPLPLGTKVNHLTVLGIHSGGDYADDTYYNCQCDCKNKTEIVVRHNVLLRGRLSCGCEGSKGEHAILQILSCNTLNGHFERQKTFDGLVGINGGKLRFDFALYSTDNKLVCLIEYDGYFHYEKGPTYREYKGVRTYDSTVEHDKRKNAYCEENNIPLYRISGINTIQSTLLEILKKHSLLIE